MIDKKYVYENVLPYVKEKGRKIDYYLIENLFVNKDKEIIEELKRFQNKDLGFGNALEADVRMPQSSVLATNNAVQMLKEVKDPSLKEDLIKDIVEYYEKSYNQEKNRFLMVGKEVDDYPHAVWWNYKDLEKNFPFGNPDPEVIGFLYKNRKYLKELNINSLINSVVVFIKSEAFLESGMHTLLSVLEFNKNVDKDVSNLIHERIHLLVNKEIRDGIGKWEEYSLEPYKVYLIDLHFIGIHQELLEKNLEYLLDKVQQMKVEPNWKWHQYDDVFEEVKYDWIGHLYFSIIKALRLHRN